jgi:hypothetical protein
VSADSEAPPVPPLQGVADDTASVIIEPAGVQLPPVQGVVDNTGNILDWGTMENDKLNNCVVACIGHTIEAWTRLGSGSLSVIRC